MRVAMTHTARVKNGRLVLDEPTDLPDGTLLELYDASDLPDDELDEGERVELKRAIEQSRAEEKAGKIRPAKDVIAELRSTR